MKKLLLILLLSLPCWAQNMRFDAVVWGPKGPVPNATVAVCTQPATTTTTPCTPLASLCSSLTDTSCTSPNPLTADSLGNYHFYAKTTVGPYTVQVYGPQVAVPYVLIDQYLNGTITGGTFANPTITGTVAGGASYTSPTLTGTVSGAATYAHPQFSTGIQNNGTGFQHVRVANCTTGTTQFSTCSITVTWPVAFADANYTAVCIPGATTNFGFIEQGTKAAASLQIFLVNAGSGTAFTAGLDCIAVHD